MAPPPRPKPLPPTARPVAASEPNLPAAEANGRAVSSASSSMPLPPPPKPGPSAPQAEAETETAGAEGGAVTSPSVGASVARDQPNTSGTSVGNTVTEEAAASDRQREQWARAPYAIPEWGAAPSRPFFLEVLKDGTIVDQLNLSMKGAYLFGRVDLCDFVLLHQSISRFHAILQFGNDGRIFLYDLGSIHGCFINKSLIKKKLYTEVHVGDVIQFGESSRRYIFRGPSELLPPIANLKKDIDGTRVNDISHGGLTQGQHTPIARNEQISQIVEKSESTSSRSGKAKQGIHSSSRSVESKRSRVSTDYEKPVKCKRELVYGPSSLGSDFTLHEYATHGLTKTVKVPYMEDEIKMGKDGVKLVLLKAFGLVVDLHCEGLTLKGSFDMKHFLISRRTQEVLLQGIEPERYSKGDDIVDKLQFVKITKHMFGNDLPTDIQVWLECIANDTDNNVLRKHVNMLHSDSIFGEFCTMYHGMLELKSLDENKFKRLMKKTGNV